MQTLEQEVAAAAEELSTVLSVAVRRGFRKDRTRAAELIAELSELDRASVAWCESTDDDKTLTRALIGKYQRVTELAADAIKLP